MGTSGQHRRPLAILSFSKHPAYVWREGRGVEKIKTVQNLFYPEGKEGRFLKNQPSSLWGGGCGWVGPLWANRPAGWSPTECDVVETATVLKSSLPGPEVGVAWPVQQWRDFVSDMLGISAPRRVLCQDSHLSPLHPWILLAPEVPAFLGQRPQREREREREVGVCRSLFIMGSWLQEFKNLAVNAYSWPTVGTNVITRINFNPPPALSQIWKNSIWQCFPLT